MKHRLFYILLLVFLLGILPVAAQTPSPYIMTPLSGSGGTQVQVSSVGPCTGIYLQPEGSEFASDSKAQFDASGSTAYFTIPDGYDPNTRIDVICGISDPDTMRYEPIGTFVIMDACELNPSASPVGLVPGSIPLAQSSGSQQRFQATDLTVDASGRFSAIVDIGNNSGQVLQVVVSSFDVNQLLDYLNSASIDFYVAPTNYNASCSQVNGSRSPDPINNQGDIDIQFELVPSSSVNSTQGYVLYVSVDPPLNERGTNLYLSPNDQIGGASAGISTRSGEVLMSMWNNSQNYYGAVDTPADGNPTISLVSSSSDIYSVLVRGIGRQNLYTINMSFTATACHNCTVSQGPAFILLDNGIGLSDHSAMHNGEFQVEGYCSENGQSARQDGYNWYCSGRQLTVNDYNQICHETYRSHPNSFAIQDGNGQVASYNWRCYDSNTGNANSNGNSNGNSNTNGNGNSNGNSNNGASGTVGCSNSPATRLTIGQQASVAPGTPNNLRSSPTGQVISQIPGGAVVTILDGPQCGRSNDTFWQVNYNGQVGWTAEGQGRDYWLVPG